ncbi:MAG: nickel-dependent hydrogenase large subunit, partial [archaeon]
MHDTKIPLGPFHPLTKEPEQLKIYVKDKKVVDTEFFLGYNHRGIEKIAENRTYDKVLYLVERICGICSNAHNSAFSHAVEKAAGLEPNERAKKIRGIVAELERIQSNLLWLGTQSHFLEHDDLFKQAMTDREVSLELLEKISGKRIHYGLAEFGGVKTDMNKETMREIKKKTDVIEENTKDIYEEVMSRESYVDRLKGVAKLSRKRAKELGVVGPVARASGLKIDSRKDNGYDAYPLVDFKVMTDKKGDALARTE